jgi:pimeloyl-ACP methyl ester carboxylesterase
MFMQVLSPSTSLWDQQTLFVIHGPGESLRARIRQWSPLTDEGWTLVFPQWERPEDLRAHLEDCRTRRGLDRSRLVVVGVSEGGPFALDLAREVGVPCMKVSGDEPLAVIASEALKAIPPTLER